MNSKDIFNEMRRHHEFVDEVTHSVSRILNDFTKSDYGQKYKTTVLEEDLQFDEAMGLLTLESNHRLDEGPRHEISVRVLGHGQVEVYSSWYVSSNDNESSSFKFGFDPETSTVKCVAARILSAIAASPDSEVSADFDRYILPKIGRVSIAAQANRDVFPGHNLG